MRVRSVGTTEARYSRPGSRYHRTFTRSAVIQGLSNKAAPADRPCRDRAFYFRGDPEVARMMGEECPLPQRSRTRATFCVCGQGRDLFRRHHAHVVFFTRHRYLTRGTRLMAHERKVTLAKARGEASGALNGADPSHDVSGYRRRVASNLVPRTEPLSVKMVLSSQGRYPR
jgi:hypothetical protein